MRFALLFALWGLCLPTAAWAEVDVCQHLKLSSAPRVSLQLMSEPLTYNRALSLDELRQKRLSAGDHAHSLEKGSFAAGLYVSGFHVSWSLGFQSVSNRQTGQSCVGIESVETVITLAKPEISIAREVRPGTCLYKEVTAHEQRHAQQDVSLLNAERSKILASLKDDLSQLEPVQAASATLAAELLKSQVGQVIEPLISSLNLSRVQLQADIDSPEEYQRVSSLCQSDVRALAKN